MIIPPQFESLNKKTTLLGKQSYVVQGGAFTGSNNYKYQNVNFSYKEKYLYKIFSFFRMEITINSSVQLSNANGFLSFAFKNSSNEWFRANWGDIYNKEITVSKYFYVTKASLNYDYNYLALNYTMYDFANMEYTLSIYSSTNPYIPFWYLPYVNNIIPPSSEVLNIDIKIEGIE